MEIQQIEVPGMSKAERAFLVNGEHRVAVKIVRTVESELEIHVKATARMIDDSGKTLKSGDAEIVPPGHVVGVMKDALADGRETIESVMAQATTDAIRRTLGHRAAMIAWQKIPAEEAK